MSKIPKSVEKDLGVLALKIVGVAATREEARLTKQNHPNEKTASAIGSTADIAAALRASFVAATEKVHEAGGKATIAEIRMHMNKVGLAKDLLTVVAFAAVDQHGSDTMQCVADVAKVAFDATSYFALAPTGPIGWVAASVQAAGLVAQIYAADASCTKAVTKGIEALKKKNAALIKHLAGIKARITTDVNEYIESAVPKIAEEFDPANYVFDAMPGAALKELQLGLLFTLKTAALGDAFVFLNNIAKTKVAPKDSVHIGSSIVWINKGGKGSANAKLSPKDLEDAARVGKRYVNLSIGSAFSTYLDDVPGGLITKSGGYL